MRSFVGACPRSSSPCLLLLVLGDELDCCRCVRRAIGECAGDRSAILFVFDGSVVGEGDRLRLLLLCVLSPLLSLPLLPSQLLAGLGLRFLELLRWPALRSLLLLDERPLLEWTALTLLLSCCSSFRFLSVCGCRSCSSSLLLVEQTECERDCLLLREFRRWCFTRRSSIRCAAGLSLRLRDRLLPSLLLLRRRPDCCCCC